MTAEVETRPVAAGTGAREHTREDDVVQVKVWQAPVRLLHWGLVASIVVLSVTGFYIGDPALAPGSGSSLVMAWMRAVHVVAAFVFVAVLVGRVIFMFTGNQWARWHQFLPVWRERRALIWPSLRYYLFLDKEPPPVVGHNPLAGMTYVVLFGMFVVQTLTGVALMAVSHRGSGWEWALTGWMFHVTSAPAIRLVHHLVMWLTWGFVIHHVYSATLVDREEHCGEVSSMVSGWKTLPRRRVEAELRRGGRG